MRRFFSVSFRNRLFAAFLAASLFPLLLCSAMLLQIFRLRMTDDVQEEAAEHLGGVVQILDEACHSFVQTAAAIQNDPLLIQALSQSGTEETAVYIRLLEVTQSVRSSARFDLYDAQGRWLYSTRSGPLAVTLPLHWGVLYAAGRQGALAFSTPENPSAFDAPLLQGALPLQDSSGAQLGYLLISLYQSDLSRLLESSIGARNDLLLLSPYWRPVYCSQPSLAESLAERLRQHLLSGEPLGSGGEEFTYTVARDSGTELYAVLRQPQVFTRDTMGLLYTVSLSIALICLMVSILLSLTLSQQMFHPIERLHSAIGEVSHNNLDVYVPHERDDELGQLAKRFNGMLIALKRNQEELVEHQKELNEAQIRMLQSQLNPHFLCNTLDTMKWISKINKVPQVALMSTNLADILRFCVSPDEFVPLRRELEILRRYVEIQRIRLSDSFTFSLDVPSELEDCLVPKMILQPIVENAILHGLEGVERGVIQVRAEEQGCVLSISVTDNGHGLPPELEGRYACRDREFSRGHLGLYNVDTILRKHYGDRFGLYLSNCPKVGGAAVTAFLSLQREEEGSC